MSDTEKPNEQQDDGSPFGGDCSNRYDPQTIQARFPAALDDTKRRCGVACVRNPDARLPDIVDLLDADPNVSEDAVLGALGHIADHGKDTLPRTTDELYEQWGISDPEERKYVTAIEWLARGNHRFNANGYYGGTPQEETAKRITEDTGVEISSGSIGDLASRRMALLAQVRLVIAIHQRHRLDGPRRDAFEIAVREARFRPILSALDYDLPGENLDVRDIQPPPEQELIEAPSESQQRQTDASSAVGADGGAVSPAEPSDADGPAGEPERVGMEDVLNALLTLNQQTQQGVETLLMRDAAPDDELPHQFQTVINLLENARNPENIGIQISSVDGKTEISIEYDRGVKTPITNTEEDK